MRCKEVKALQKEVKNNQIKKEGWKIGEEQGREKLKEKNMKLWRNGMKKKPETKEEKIIKEDKKMKSEKYKGRSREEKS